VGKLNEHRVRIKSQFQLQKSRLEKGMIVRVRYTPIISGKQRGPAVEYMLLILNPIFKKKIHALSLDNFGFVRLNELATETGIVYIPSFAKKRKLNLPKLEMKQSSQRFYATSLKRDMSTKWGDSYRTFDEKFFNKIFLVDYKFSDILEEKFLLDDTKTSSNKTLEEKMKARTEIADRKKQRDIKNKLG